MSQRQFIRTPLRAGIKNGANGAMPNATVQVSFHNTYTFVLNTEQKPRTHGRVRRGGVATKLKLNNNAPTSFSFPVTRDLIAIIIS